jgi:hypothetical protein
VIFSAKWPGFFSAISAGPCPATPPNTSPLTSSKRTGGLEAVGLVDDNQLDGLSLKHTARRATRPQAHVVLELFDAALQAGAFLADRVGGHERALHPLGPGVQRGQRP